MNPNSAPTLYPELEIGLHRLAAETFQAELRFCDPASEAEVPSEKGPAALDLAELLTLQQDPRAYGEALAAQVFADERVRGLYGRVKTAVEASGRFLRLRLLVGPSAPELHGLRWELLRDPETRAPLATSEKTLFSRFMVSQDWRPVKLRRKSDLNALIAVAAPSDIAIYGLSVVDRDGEIARAQEGLCGIHTTVLGCEEPLTLNRLTAALRREEGEGIDVLYLVCHGTLARGQIPWLFLQDDDGNAARVEGAALAERLRELPEPPRLVVLASCESGGTADGSTQAALAPRLAEAGVTAVVAMQGQISMETVEKAIPVFFSELGKDGQIDRALALARGTVRDRADAWMPALYLRLKSGRLWYEPGFAGEEDQFKKWRSIAGSIRQGRSVPILGPDVGEDLYGTARERADRLAAAHGFPLEPHDRSDLAKVAQYLSVIESRQFARDAVADQLKAEIRRRHPGLADEPKLFETVVKSRTGDDDPFRILAGLEAPIYVTASADPVLLLSLLAAGHKPKPLYCKWRKTRDNHPAEPPYEGVPQPKSPVVYYPFGVSRKGEEDSLVLTEDDFLDYLIAAADYKLIPTVVRGTLVRSSLLFLGFTLDDLAFRVLFRLIMSLDGSSQLGDYAHVGVQVDPEAHSLIDVERARDYLTQYFGTGRDTPRIDVYWGTATDFLKELRDQLATTGTDDASTAAEETEDEWVTIG